ncbi:hypothetical protein PIB30_034907 [Stylosanthes scabra]|uniref:Uncharacterized protein n=1 Tax=Stylosanthes scabra TaxID=79078 RepID=A0ABU6TDP5_9FABA|nr:hypothetical protein [Stylosanthes scabra]
MVRACGCERFLVPKGKICGSKCSIKNCTLIGPRVGVWLRFKIYVLLRDLDTWHRMPQTIRPFDVSHLRLLLLFLNDLRHPLVLFVKNVLLRSLDLRRPSVVSISNTAISASFLSKHPIQSLLQLEDSVRQVVKEEFGLNAVLNLLESDRRRQLRNEQISNAFKGVFEEVEAE